MIKKLFNLDEQSITLLQTIFNDCVDTIGKSNYNQRLKEQQVFWINLWQLSDNNCSLTSKTKNILTWVSGLLEKSLNAQPEIMRIQLIINPIGSINQRWHIDYNNYVSTIFVPLVPLNMLNSPEFITLLTGREQEITHYVSHNPHDIDLTHLASLCDSLCLSQIITRAYSVLYMDAGTVHRGIGNTSNAHRPMLAIELIDKNSDYFNTVLPKQEQIATENNFYNF